MELTSTKTCYIASVEERNPFTEAAPARVQIDATLPALAKRGSMIAIRETGASEQERIPSY